MNIAFCCDKMALPGLYVSLASLLKTQLREDPQQALRIFIFQEGMSEKDEAGLRKTAAIHPRTEISIFPFSTGGLGNLKGLHGNFMPYGRLFLADLLPELDRLIYLDSDLLINCSLRSLWEADLGPHLIGAVSTATVEWSLEKDFLITQGLELDDPYFNSGVIILDLAQFRRDGWKERCLAFLEAHKQHCQAADQTVLNAFFSRKHLRLPSAFNLPALSIHRLVAKDLPAAILHFVGAPKPWDFGGKIIHGGGQVFADVLRETPFAEYSKSSSPPVLRHTLRLAKAYFRTIKWRLSNQKPATQSPSKTI